MRITVHRVFRSTRKWIAVMVGVALIGMLPAVALAKVTTTVLVTADLNNTVHVNSDRIKFQTKDATIVQVREVVFDADSSTAWRHRPGITIVTVESGAVTVEDSECNTVTYGYAPDGSPLPDGTVYVESGDEPGRVFTGATGGATNYATQVVPYADPPVFQHLDSPPPCAH